MKKNYVTYGLTAMIMAAGIFINASTLRDGHNWGGDFSQYILHAKNLIAHREYTSGIMLELPVVYPPGYPMLLAPLIRLGGVNFILLKALNVAFWYAAAALVIPLLGRTLRPTQTALCVSLLSLSGFFFVFKQNIIADVAFMFFVYSALYFYTCYAESVRGPNKGINRKPYRYFAFFLVTASSAFLIRSAGVALFAAAFFYALFMLRRKKDGLWTVLCFCGVYGLQVLWIGNHPGFFQEIFSQPWAFMGRMARNSALPLRSLWWFFLAPQTPLAQKVFAWTEPVWSYLSVFVYGGMLYLGVRDWRRRRLSFTDAFLFIFLGVLWVWSGFPHHPANFCRYTLPVIVPMFLFLYARANRPGRAGRVKYKRKIVIFMNSALMVMILWNVYGMIRNYDFNDDVLFQRENQALFTWIKANAGPDEHYMIWQARPVALMTGRVGTVPWQYTPGRNVSLSQRVKRLQIDYIIATKGFDTTLMGVLATVPHAVRPVWENQKYKIYAVL
jgi:hypothetical protein